MLNETSHGNFFFKKNPSRMKVRNATPHLYLEMQKGGNIPIFRGMCKRGGFSFRFLKPLASMFGKSLLKVGKKVIRKAAPEIVGTALEVGQDIMRGKKIKNVAKTALGQAGKSLGRTMRESLEEELARHVQRRQGGSLMLKRTQKLKNVQKRS